MLHSVIHVYAQRHVHMCVYKYVAIYVYRVVPLPDPQGISSKTPVDAGTVDGIEPCIHHGFIHIHIFSLTEALSGFSVATEPSRRHVPTYSAVLHC